MSEFTKQSFERRLVQANVVFACLGLGLGAFFVGHGTGLGFFEILLWTVFIFAFFSINIVFSICRYGVVCQIILLLSTLLFPVFFTYEFINAFYINLDPQSGLVFLLGPGYSILMIPFWLVTLCLSSYRENCVILLPKSWYSGSEVLLDDKWQRIESKNTE